MEEKAKAFLRGESIDEVKTVATEPSKPRNTEKMTKEIFDAETTAEMVGKAIKAGFY